MKAMILAAGLGTRLPLLEITLSRLRSFGIREVIINVHYLAGMVLDYLKANQNFGMRIEISHEEILLDTGGGLKKAAYFFLEEPDSPFIVHNVDVISSIDLERMVKFHVDRQALATLAVQDRESSRRLLFNEQFQLCDRRSERDQKDEFVRDSPQVQALAFSGIHVISPRIFSMMGEERVFSIIDSYLNLAARREKILAFRADEYYWRDLGRPENVLQATQELRREALFPQD